MNIKGMDKNMQCRGFQFEIGKEYKIDTGGRPLELGTDTVFHYCKSLSQVHKFAYDCRKDNRYFEIEVIGEEVIDGKIYGSNHIKILREIVGEELAALKGLSSTNTGLFNTGECNNGYWNSGDRNNGSLNSGDRNIGDRNCGNDNIGNDNSGHKNNGDWNSGHMNCGVVNSGHRNLGTANSGSDNYGDYNSGNGNIGERNSGHRNIGHMNTGHMNIGHMNPGAANKCDFSNGVFCNKEDMNIRIFNKPSGMSLSDFYRSRYWTAMCGASFSLTEWIEYTAEEKAADPEKERTGGYLKVNSYEEAWAKWWAELSEENKQIIQEIPNFDPGIFKDITGITV